MSVTVPSILKYLNNSNSFNIMGDNENEGSSRAKKRRLDHLTWEEKIQRKKLKNRVAAQTSRDRKKAKMEQMEQALKELYDKNHDLMAECERLRATNEKVLAENRNLHNQLQRVPCPNCGTQSRPVECDDQSGSTETPNPQPQGLVRHSAATLSRRQSSVMAVQKIAAAYLLYQIFSMSSTATSTSPRWKKSPKAFSKISPQTWKLLLKRQIAKNRVILRRKNYWWGKHQKSWNPIEVKG
ncbi:X-box-binding protein 1 [Onthophagus taurus]|uniref:X-box-binding protein 1 n=1 Tax=Onthophagus taurus TaxID=166361 RepID=UPI000C20578F|nr:X-box-binding protein 1 [Onthophagus taurus]